MSLIIQNSKETLFQSLSSEKQGQFQPITVKQSFKFENQIFFDFFSNQKALQTSRLLRQVSSSRQQIISIRNNAYRQTLQMRISFLENLLPESISSKDLSKIILGKMQMKSFQRHSFSVNIENGQIEMNYQEKLSIGHFKNLFHHQKNLKMYLQTTIKQFFRNCGQFFKEIIQKYQPSSKEVRFQKMREQSIIQNLFCIKPYFEISQIIVSEDEIFDKVEKQKQSLSNLQKKIDAKNNNIECLALYQNQIDELFTKDKQIIKLFLKNQNLIQTYQIKKQQELSDQKQIQMSLEKFLFNSIQIKQLTSSIVTIGEGGSSKIYLAKVQLSYVSSENFQPYKNQQPIVQKYIAFKAVNDQDDIKKISDQNNILKFIKGKCTKYLPRYYGVQKGTTFSQSVLMEYIVGQDLSTYFSFNKESICLQTKLTLLSNVISGLKVLARAQVTHLDLKPSNIMVTRDLVTKIIDFGEAHHAEACDQQFKPGFTYPYAAPETIHRNLLLKKKIKSDLEFSEKQDVFAFGHILAETVFKSRLHSLTMSEYPSVYLSEDPMTRIHYAPEKVKSLGEQNAMSFLFQLMMRCLHNDPTKRPQVEWIGIMLNHFMKNS